VTLIPRLNPWSLRSTAPDYGNDGDEYRQGRNGWKWYGKLRKRDPDRN
jgi:hypothetical protein